MADALAIATGAEGAARGMDQIVRASNRLTNAFYKTGLGLTYLYSKSFVNFIKTTGKAKKKSEEQLDAIQNLTIAQGFLHNKVTKHLSTTKLLANTYAILNANITPTNRHFMGMAMRLTTLIGAFLTIFSVALLVVMGFAIISAAVSGADSVIVTATANMGILHEVAKGLVFALSGEGGESGVANAVNVLMAALTFGSLAGAILGGVFAGLLVGGVILSAGLYHLLEPIIGVEAAFATAAGVLGLFTAAALYFGVGLAGMALPAAFGVITTSVMALFAGFALAFAGIAGLFLVITGHFDTFWSIVVTVVSAVLIIIGLMAIGFVAPVAIIIGVILGLITLIWRFKETAWNVFVVVMKGVAVGLLVLASPIIFLMTLVGKLIEKLGEIFEHEGLEKIGNFIGGVGGAAVGLGKSLLGRAGGGSVTGGQSYIVGEKGPEMFTPGTSGNITPNDQMGGGQTINMSINVSGVTDRTDKRDLAREIGDMINQELRRQGGATTRGRF